ncbi:fungal specific transcription factor [Colletotrichum tofieldiae]|nr:fungal specific transcription factor [Colletotrichum tofieldiae]GKT96325.1 fungal specific transcription factor [Colletotrichum tofieldiae]
MSRRRRKETAQTTTHLNACFRALEELSSSWECAKRSRDFLIMLQRKWEFRSRRLSQGARNPTSSHGFMLQSDQTSRKRARTGSSAGSRGIDSLKSLSPIVTAENPTEYQREVHESIDLDMRLDLDWVFAAGTQSMQGHWDGMLGPDAIFLNQNGTG